MTTQGTVIEVSTEQAMSQYTEAYQKLYKRTPRDLRALGNDWVIVNGIRMHVGELVYLTQQLQQEYDQMMAQRRNIVMRLLTWFK